MSRTEKLLNAIKNENLTSYRGRFVGSPMQLAQLAGVAYSTIKNVYRNARVQTYSLSGLGVLIDAEDLALYFASAKRGRPTTKQQHCN